MDSGDSRQQVKRADWVTCKGSPSVVGFVKRLARDGSWADVDWHTHTKRMPTTALEVQTTLDLGNGWSVTDRTREQELLRAIEPRKECGTDGAEAE